MRALDAIVYKCLYKLDLGYIILQLTLSLAVAKRAMTGAQSQSFSHAW